jgi:hypothetical protein
MLVLVLCGLFPFWRVDTLLDVLDLGLILFSRLIYVCWVGVDDTTNERREPR